MTHHDLKLWPEYFQPKLDGLKPWEIRRTVDRTFNVGDTVTFQEFDLARGAATGRTLGPVRIIYVLEADRTHTIFTHTGVESPSVIAQLQGRIVQLRSDLRIQDHQMQVLSERAMAAEEQLRLQGRTA
jgi:hypothetical protein